MLETNPHVKFIRVCERTDGNGRKINALIIDTNIRINEGEDIKSDFRLIELAANIREFQRSLKKSIGVFSSVEVMGNKSLLLDSAA